MTHRLSSLVIALATMIGGVSRAWAADTYKLTNNPTDATPTVNTTYFRTSASYNTNCVQTINGVSFQKAIKFNGQGTIPSDRYYTGLIAYDVRSTETQLNLYLYNGGSGDRYFNIAPVREGSTF